MKKISVIYDGSRYTYKWLKPLFWASPILKKMGYDVKFCSFLGNLPVAGNLRHRFKLDYLQFLYESSKKMDVVFLAFHHSASWLGLANSEDRIAALSRLKNSCKKICWLDTADSTGTSLFDVLPYVDLYFKKQILVDIDLYTKKLYGARLFCDYYHKLLNIEDLHISRPYPLAQKDMLTKIRLSWNVGFADLFAPSELALISNKKKLFTPIFSEVGKDKTLDVHYRGTGYSPLAGYQRTHLQELIKNAENVSHPDVTKKVPHEEYVEELRHSKAIISPFGWGEICTRDFESFVNGATLLKPTMDHCITWPDVYKPNETYVPMKWDFSDFDQVISKIGSKEYSEIAQNGQNYYKQIRFSDNSKLLFAEHLVEELEK